MSIFRKEDGLLRDCLSDQQLIERIAVMHGQSHQCPVVRLGDFQKSKTFRGDGCHDFVQVRFQFADPDFHGDFPERHHTDQDIVRRVGDESTMAPFADRRW